MKLRLLPLLLALVLVPAVYAQDALPESLSFEVFTDGVVRTDYSLTVDQTAAQVNITLFGETVQDLFIYDEEGLPLESTKVDGYYQVNTLGASSVDVSYLTADLTGKVGAIWSINVETPISTEVTLPLSSTIINLNEIPLEIETKDDQTKLVMPSGNVTVRYTIDIKDSQSLADDEIIIAQNVIESGLEQGVKLPTAEDLLQDALLAFESEDYLTAYEKASEAIDMGRETITLAVSIRSQLEELNDRMQEAKDAGRTVGLDVVKSLLDEADSHFENGEYMEITGIIQEVNVQFHSVSIPESNNNSYVLLLAGILVLAAVGYLLSKRKTPEPIPEEDEIDLELLYEEHPELRVDDREALRFMAEHGGEAFAHEVRERIGIPRTSAWRMIQRLQRFEVIEEKKIGGQSLVSIVDKYRRRKK